MQKAIAYPWRTSFPSGNESLQQEGQKVWECIELAVEADVLVA